MGTYGNTNDVQNIYAKTQEINGDTTKIWIYKGNPTYVHEHTIKQMEYTKHTKDMHAHTKTIHEHIKKMHDIQSNTW